MNDCILVGNGTSLLDKNQGGAIDQHAIVCRFNNCCIAGFEPQAGTKTNVWFTVMPFHPNLTGRLCPLDRIIAHSWERSPDKCATLKGYTHPKAEKLDHAVIPEISAWLGDDSYRTWSTGILAIWMMLKEHAEVSLTGFDWWERKAHHYCDNAIRGTLHRPQTEKAMIEKLQSEGRVSFL